MNKVLTSSKKMNWGTPDDLFKKLDDEFDIAIDLAATEQNSKCVEFVDPGLDSLSLPWSQLCGGDLGFGWLNPPYGRSLGKWVAKAAEERRRGANVVMLIPARTDTRYFHTHLWDKTKNAPRDGIEIRLLEGRIKFIDPDTGKPGDPAPFPSMVVVFRGSP